MSDLSISGIHHLELTVRDLKRSEPWYTRVLGFERMGAMDKDDHSVVMLRAGDLVIGLVQHTRTGDDSFDERRIGLDHAGFSVSSPEDVERWAARLDELGVERTEVKDGALPDSRVVIFRDPDGIQLECYYAP
ncbi:MAG TPA: VOC family protein [Frankiaceae bacterium]|nr:VOC family protein [Frankiaceae bacterium]